MPLGRVQTPDPSHHQLDHTLHAALHRAKPQGLQPVGTPKTCFLLSLFFPQRTVTIFQVPCPPTPSIPTWSAPSCLPFLEVGWVPQTAISSCLSRLHTGWTSPFPPFPAQPTQSWGLLGCGSRLQTGTSLLGLPRRGIYMALPKRAPKQAL